MNFIYRYNNFKSCVIGWFIEIWCYSQLLLFLDRLVTEGSLKAIKKTFGQNPSEITKIYNNIG